jgi:PIN domain nuclease of toxin-antitoxin system
VRLLLDTHIFIWGAMGDSRLGRRPRALIQGADEVFVSSASIWKMAIKAGLGKLAVDIDLLVLKIQSSGFVELPVHSTHAVRVRSMPNIHRDPFDRILIAQAISGPLHLMTKDRKLAAYSHLVITV